MASTYSSNNGIELIGTGEQSGTWGETTNTNLQIIDRALSGVGTIDLSGSAAAHTLTTTDGTLSDGMYKILILDGATEACTITISPNDSDKFYLVYNNSGYACTFTQGSGGDTTIANGDAKIIYANGVGAGSQVSDFTANISSSSINITGGSVTGITDLAVADGGTGSSTVAGAQTNLQVDPAGTAVALAIALG